MADEAAVAAALAEESILLRQFNVQHQDVEVSADFRTQTLTGKTTIHVEPLSLDLKSLQLRCRQMEIKTVKIDSHTVTNYTHSDPYRHLTARDEFTVEQHHLINCGVERKLSRSDNMELTVPMPPSVLRAWERASEPSPFTITIEYVVYGRRDALHWVGIESGDFRYPHVYTYSNSLRHTQACYVFPCFEGPGIRNTWTITIECPRSIADLSSARETGNAIHNGTNGVRSNGVKSADDTADHLRQFTDDEKELEISAVCSGYMDENDAPTANQATRRKWVFSCKTAVAPRHVGFAIGPFELVELSQFRESEDDEKLGRNIVSVHGFCLPGRSEEVRNSCVPIASAIDKFSTDFSFYPFDSSSTSYKLCFVDDLPFNVVDTATLSICTSRLLVPDNVIDTLYDSTRELIHAVASQWLGVKISARDPEDSWIIVGCSYFMADQFLIGLWGKNEHRFRLKQASDKICDLDVRRPSIYDIGAELDVDAEEYQFLKLKAPMVLTILHHRIIKANGRNGVDRMIKRMLLDEQVGKLEDGEIETERFKRIYEKVAHSKPDSFFNQWVHGTGCPTFQVTQRFNKKKLVVDMTVTQNRSEGVGLELTPDSYMRKVKEREEFAESPVPQLLFTGPMTIRIHEADGTPYEHIVDIRELMTKVEIPYNTKYKRLKRNRRQKERAVVTTGLDGTDVQDDVLLYCLGDVLQTEEEIRDWDLADWSQKDEDAMNNEHYEWIRLDKDFEWIVKIQFDSHPSYMWVSQLQQDNDVAAQVESVQWLARQPADKLYSSILARTLMDTRYFYGIRVIAAHALAREATEELDWIGMRHLIKAFQEFFCFDGSLMPRANSFADRRNYRIQCAIPEALSLIRDSTGRAPNEVKDFFINQLRYNDNSSNEYSDAYYVSTLVTCLAQSLAGSPQTYGFAWASVEQEVKDMEYVDIAVKMIHRYQRIDEFLPSFSNLYSVTALESQKLLMNGKSMPRKLGGILQHTQPGNSELVRLKAFSCLIDLGAFSNSGVLVYFISTFSTSSSPYFRSKLWGIICRGFGTLALTPPAAPEQSSEQLDGLLVEEGTTLHEQRQALLAKLQNVDEASSFLKQRMKREYLIQEAVMDAIRSQKLDLMNFLDVLSLCRVMYDTFDSLPLVLKYPQYWKIDRVDNTVVYFKKTGRYRSRPFTTLEDRWPDLRKKRPRTEATAPTEPNEVPEAKKPKIETTVQQPTPTEPSARPSGTPIIRLFGFGQKAASPAIQVKQEEAVPKPPTPRSATPAEQRVYTRVVVLKLPMMKLLKYPLDNWGSSRPGTTVPPASLVEARVPSEARQTPSVPSVSTTRQPSAVSSPPPPISTGAMSPPIKPTPPPLGERKPSLKIKLNWKS
jgi:transcription initiation factor TFIID subunit 2